MYEVEVKVIADHDAVRERLSATDAESLGTVIQEDIYYDAPHRNFVETDEALRIRKETDESADASSTLTYKGPLVDDNSKTREEVETEVVDLESLREILENLGFDPVARVRKHRERFRWQDFVLSLDTVDDLGDFVEVETEVTEDDIDDAREDAFDILSRLDLDPDDQIRTSYLTLLLSEKDFRE